MTSGLGKQAVLDVKENINSHEEPNINCFDEMLGTGQSAVWFIGLYSNKMNTVKDEGVAFYAIHIYLLNMKKRITEDMINTGLTAVAFLPTKCFR